MQNDEIRKGRAVLVAVTVIAVALQVIKLGSRGMLLGRWPTPGQWGQLAIVAWVLFSLWEGKPWARVIAAVYYTLATVAGAAILVLVWWQIEVPLRWVSLLIVVLAGGASIVLWFSGTLQAYMADRIAGGAPAP